jgi:hypothetical protein
MLVQTLVITVFATNAAICIEGDHDVLRGRDTTAAVSAKFSESDNKLLDEIEFASFQYFWKEVGAPAMLAKDRLKAPVSSIAAVGFQLSALPIGVERGWITKEQGRQRATTVLRALLERDDNKRHGVYLHFPDMNTGGLSHVGFEVLASTVDHALLVAGAIPASVYFGGEVESLVDRLIADTNWKAFEATTEGFLSMGWKPDDPEHVDGPGKLFEWHWWVASDEERLVYFLAVGAPRSEYAIDPSVYYRLNRTIKGHKDMRPYAVSWPGTLFTYFFSHCWIDYRSLAADDPSLFGVEAPRVDWFENSRRAVLTHRARCREQVARFKTLGDDRWGLSACAARDGYIVPSVGPNLLGKDEWFEGTVAPYAAGAAIMFAPEESLAALRAFRSLRTADGKPMVWRDPSDGGYGFVDSFNLDQSFASDDYVGIDQGPLLLGIENARTGLIWKLFMQHPAVQRSLARLRLTAPATQPAP